MHHDTPRPPALCVRKPRLYQVACELSTFKDPYGALNALMEILSAGMKGGGGDMSNNEKFNAMPNSCRDPQAVHDALYALAPVIRKARSVSPENCFTDTPNFLRLAQELNKFKDPYKAADMLLASLSRRKGVGMDSNDFNAVVNSCQTPAPTTKAELLAAIMELTMEERAELLSMWKVEGGAAMNEESRLIAMIRNSNDPARALEIAVEMILKVLCDHR